MKKLKKIFIAVLKITTVVAHGIATVRGIAEAHGAVGTTMITVLVMEEQAIVVAEVLRGEQ